MQFNILKRKLIASKYMFLIYNPYFKFQVPNESQLKSLVPKIQIRDQEFQQQLHACFRF